MAPVCVVCLQLGWALLIAKVLVGPPMGSMLEGRDVRVSRLRPCHPHPLPHVWLWACFFLVEVELELGTLLQGGIREFGAHSLSVALPHTR